jgi:hypothetical protein
LPFGLSFGLSLGVDIWCCQLVLSSGLSFGVVIWDVRVPCLFTYLLKTLFTRKNGRNGYLAAGITSSWTRNPPDEWKFRKESLCQEQGIHRLLHMIILPGITSSWTRIHRTNEIPPKITMQVMDEESTEGIGFWRDYQLLNACSDKQEQNVQKILRTPTIPGSIISNALYNANVNVKMLNTVWKRH